MFDLECEIAGYCYICEFQDITYFNLNGLCHGLEDLVDPVKMLTHKYFQCKLVSQGWPVKSMKKVLLCPFIQVYLVNMEKLDQNIEQGIVFEGFRKTRILFDRKLGQWVITSKDNLTPILNLTSQGVLPIGPQQWDIPHDVCGNDRKERKEWLLSTLHNKHKFCSAKTL